MLKNINNKNAQTIATEYAMVFFVVIGMVVGMTVYFKRAVQARIRDAHNSVILTVKNRIGTLHTGNKVYVQYEPYYRNTSTLIDRDSSDTTQVLPSLPLSSGIFRKTFDQETTSISISNTLPSVNAD